MKTPKFSFLTGFLLTLTLGLGLMVATPVFAQEAFGLTSDLAASAGFAFDEPLGLIIAKLIRTFIGLLGIIAVALILWGGAVWMTAGGRLERVQTAKKILRNAVIGLVIILSSFAIASFIIGAISEATGSTGISGTTDPNTYPPPSGGSQDFYLNGVNVQCAEYVSNFELQLTFSRKINSDTISSDPNLANLLGGGIVLTDSDDQPVAGNYEVSGSKVTFIPQFECPTAPGYKCFKPGLHTITIDPAVLKASNGRTLDCNIGPGCAHVFTIGSNAKPDTTAPSATINLPTDGAQLEGGLIHQLQTQTNDDVMVSNADFIVDNDVITTSGLALSETIPASQELPFSDQLFFTDPLIDWDSAGFQTNEDYAISARVYDCAGNSAKAPIVRPVLRAAICFIPDPVTNELPCGGDPNADDYCGACEGDKCSENSECSSGYCVDGFCENLPTITRVSPGDGAVGNLITLKGQRFTNTPGTIVFHGDINTPADDQKVTPYICDGTTQWTDTQIIVEVPVGAVDGPIEMIRNDDSEEEPRRDRTDDTTGPFINDFDVNDVIRPGLCVPNPTQGPPNTPVSLLGVNLGDSIDSSSIYFDNILMSNISSWTNTQVDLTTPALNARRYDVQAFVGDNVCEATPSLLCPNGNECGPSDGQCILGREGSNKVEFRATSFTTANPPIINDVHSGWKACSGDVNFDGQTCVNDSSCGGGSCIDVDWGPPGQYVTILGSNFGATQGLVWFEQQVDTSKRKEGDISFPESCDNQSWSDSQVVVKVPDQYANDPIEFVTHDLYLIRVEDSAESNRLPFEIIDDTPGPAICKIDPVSGPEQVNVTVYGDNFGTNAGSYEFSSANNPIATTFGAWDQNQIDSILVPIGAQTGPTQAISEDGKASNAVNFAVVDCREDLSACGDGTECCADGTCSSSCPAPPVSSYVWRFSTAALPIKPVVYEFCGETETVPPVKIVSPSPWEIWNEPACVNSSVHIRFIGSDGLPIVMDSGTLVDANILVEECNDQECESPTAVDSNTTAFLSTVDSMTWEPAAPFNAGARYKVSLNGSAIRAEDTIERDGDFLGEYEPFFFTVQTDPEPCQADFVTLAPAEYTLDTLGETVDYNAIPGANRCTTLAASAFGYSWSVDAAHSSDIGLPNTSTPVNTATAQAETGGTPAIISAQIVSPAAGPEGIALLSVDFSDPDIAAVRPTPNCGETCLDADIGAEFTIWMDDTTADSVESANNYEIWECINENCDASSLGTTLTSLVGSIDCLESNPDTAIGGCRNISIGLNGSLTPNTYYRVVIKGNVESVSGVALHPNGTNNDGGFVGDYSWVFRTATADSATCDVDRVALIPESARANLVGERREFSAAAFGKPDDCAPNGQQLRADSVSWSIWQSFDNPDNVPPANNVASLLESGGIQLSNSTPQFCTASCLKTGSIITDDQARCGDGDKDFGEDCDGGPGCSDICLHTGSPLVADGGTCGNGVLDAGEDCDIGILNTQGCSNTCLKTGSAGSADCTDNFVDLNLGEECRDGNTIDGDGCSSRCLNEGSIALTIANAIGICGNGNEEAGEACDDGNSLDGDGCSSSCLNEGSDTDYGSLCGNGGAPETGEDCDDGNTFDGDGCSSECLFEGSSAYYDTASFCGDGDIEIGEACEDTVGPYSISDYAVAEINSTAVQEVDPITSLAISAITATADGVTGFGEYAIECSCTNDASCGSSGYACGASNCCFEQPIVTNLLPIPPVSPPAPSNRVCPNTVISADIVWPSAAGEIDASSLPGNMYLALRVSDDDGDGFPEAKPPTCPTDDGHILALNQEDITGNWLARTWKTFVRGVKNLFGFEASAQLPGDCVVDADYQLVDIADGVQVQLRLKDILDFNAEYELVVLGDDPNTSEREGVLTTTGVPIQSGRTQLFTTAGEICLVDEVIVSDQGRTEALVPPILPVELSQQRYTKLNEEHEVYGYTLSGGQPVQSIAGIYDWTWAWDISEGIDAAINILDISNPDAPNSPETVRAISPQDNGKANVLAEITDSLNQTVEGSQSATVFLCERPLFFDDIGTSKATNFSFSYCQDFGDPETTGDDLPSMREVDVDTLGLGGIFKELLYIIEGEGDAIGVRIVSNNEYLPPEKWYIEQDFDGSPEFAIVDGYEAVRDGNTFYVFAANQTGDIFPNIYVISFSDNPSGASLEIFNQVVSTFRFNENEPDITDWNICRAGEGGPFMHDADGSLMACSSNNDCGNAVVCIGDTDSPSTDGMLCTNDDQCGAGKCEGSVNGFCDAQKAKLQRDTQRLSDIVRLQDDISSYGDSNGVCEVTRSQSCVLAFGGAECPLGESCVPTVPTLQEGSFIRTMSVSTWPSWVSQLGNAIGTSLPVDPLNEMIGCVDPYDPDTCFDSSAGQFQCNAGSHIYGYQSSGGQAYTLYTQLEHNKAPWAFAIDKDTSDDSVILAEYDTYVGPPLLSDSGFVANGSFCSGAIVGDSDICGDGISAVGEICEIGDIIQNSCTTGDQCTAGDADKIGTSCLNDGECGFLGKCENLEGLQSMTCINLAIDTRYSGYCEGGSDNGFGCNNSSECSSGTCAIPTVPTCAYERQADTVAECIAFRCGNGVVEDNEQCDDGAGRNGQYGYCGADCQVNTTAFCGDGFLSGPEQCDCTDALHTHVNGSWAFTNCRVNGVPYDNGQYAPAGAVNCSSTCQLTGPTCGDGIVNGGEECDGGFEEQACADLFGNQLQGHICDGGVNAGRQCGGVCGNLNPLVINYFSSCLTDAECGPGLSCLTGTLSPHLQDCGADSLCSSNTFPLTRARSCNQNSCEFDSYGECIGGNQRCGNGVIEGSEQCDDGNSENGDECTNSCQIAFCGDGIVNELAESCDAGIDNGVPCDAPYGGTCTFCTNSCEFQSRSGAFCGNGTREIEGGEACDGNDLSYSCIDARSNREVKQLGLCDPSDEGNQGSCSAGYTCQEAGVCNGGPFHGEPCTTSGSTYDIVGDRAGCSTPLESGTCEFPVCKNDCQSQCPYTQEVGSLQATVEEANATPQSTFTIYNFGSGITPDNASIHFPVCRYASSITADIDLDVSQSFVDVVFVTDISGSMGTSVGSGLTRLDITKDALQDALGTFFSSQATVRVAVTTFHDVAEIGACENNLSDQCSTDSDCASGACLITNFEARCSNSGTYDATGITCKDHSTCETGSCIGSPQNLSQTRMSQMIEAYTTKGGTRPDLGIENALRMLNDDSPNHHRKVIVLMADGAPDNASDGNPLVDTDYWVSIGQLKDDNGRLINGDIEVFTAAITDDYRDIGALAHMSNDICEESNFEDNGFGDHFDANFYDRKDCVPPLSGIEYAFDGTSENEIAEMYDTIANTIVTGQFSIVGTDSNGDPLRATSSIAEGNNVVLPLPEGLCDEVSAKSLPISFNCAGQCSATISDIQFNYCGS